MMDTVYWSLPQVLSNFQFGQPQMLWLALLPVAVLILTFWSRSDRRAALASVGLPVHEGGRHGRPPRTRRLGRVALGLAWLLAILAAARPEWGQGDSAGVAVGRDVVLVMDLSRSMLADDTMTGITRWQSAVAGVMDLLDWFGQRGGHRVGVIVFAARPQELIPLTTDLDHVRSKLRELDPLRAPPETRPGIDETPSGTRIGLALIAAVRCHDARFPGSRDIILVSDGDDPAEDREWTRGVSAARDAAIPIYTVGVGDPDRDSPIVMHGKPLGFVDQKGVWRQASTRLREDVLTAIATEGRGAYWPARREVPRLAELARDVIESQPARELDDDTQPQRKDRSAGFLVGAALCFVLGCWWER